LHDTRGTRTAVHQGMDSLILVLEQGVALPRHVREEVCSGVKTGGEEDSRGEEKGPRKAGCEHHVGVVEYEAGAEM
jgi:hypothetical protein